MNDAPARPDTTPDSEIASDDPSERVPDALLIDHRPNIGQRCLRALVAFRPGETIAPFGASKTLARPSRMTVQVSEDEHILLAPRYLENVNHGCEPNVYFDPVRWELVALEPIAAGDELVFFYPSTEWHMASAFECGCGSGRCLGRITGASGLPPRLLAGHRLTPHIQRLLEHEARREHAFEIGLFPPLFAASPA